MEYPDDDNTMQKYVGLDISNTRIMRPADSVEAQIDEIERTEEEEDVALYSDSQSAIHLVKNPAFHSQTKHIEVKYHFIWQLLEKKMLQLKKIRGDRNPADMLTKARVDGATEDEDVDDATEEVAGTTEVVDHPSGRDDDNRILRRTSSHGGQRCFIPTRQVVRTFSALRRPQASCPTVYRELLGRTSRATPSFIASYQAFLGLHPFHPRAALSFIARKMNTNQVVVHPMKASSLQTEAVGTCCYRERG
ncbi:Unknown protein [Striga hermonthica]|uniref:Uncharacterized protein n=1 Tax=Striga hermonthica TaxID=68872 RepID=A0A9N7N982_STRHE|nr:Unknown protein [Striga hermonthica]